MINPGSQLPPFKTTACVGISAGHEFREVSSSEFAGKWLVFYTYPKDFTFVCPTEIVEFDQKLPAFEQRGAVLLGGSTDNEYAHLAWRRADEQLAALRHPLLFISPEIAAALDILHPTAGVALRATLIIDPAGVVRLASTNDLDVGRNVDEIIRVLDALQTGELTACNWRPGQATLSSKAG